MHKIDTKKLKNRLHTVELKSLKNKNLHTVELKSLKDNILHSVETKSLKDNIKNINLKSVKQRAEGERLTTVKEARRKIVQGTSVAVVLVSILTGLAFTGPAEITADQVGTQINQPPVVMDIGDYANATVDDDDDEDAITEKKGFARFVRKFKQAVLSLPRAVRVLIIVPLWAVGTGITATISVLWKFIVATPIGGFLLSTFIGFGVLLGLYVVTAKMLFPDVPVKKLINKRSVISIAVVAVLLGLADVIVPMYWNKYPLVAWLVKFTTGLITVSALASKVKHLSLANILPQAS